MIKNIRIENFKSIENINLPLGRLNVLIGENGAGKSNILEAIAIAGAASARKLDNEFLTSRGIRVTDPTFMKSAFNKPDPESSIKVTAWPQAGASISYTLENDEKPYSSWFANISFGEDSEKGAIPQNNFFQIVTNFLQAQIEKENREKETAEFLNKVNEALKHGTVVKSPGKPDSLNVSVTFDASAGLGKYLVAHHEKETKLESDLSSFIIYSPENTALRDFQREGQILPLGINGEGLFKLIQVEIDSTPTFLEKLNDFLSLLGWFDSLKLSKESSSTSPIRLTDRFLHKSSQGLDLRSSNEGFLFLVFYFTLFSSQLTPRFFAIDNIDASLNPKLCRRLIEELNRLAEVYGKQVILTTHNPAVLDGLNLDDPQQKLYAVSRGMDGETAIRPIKKPRKISGEPPVKLSESFMNGALGGLPTGF